MPRGRFTLDAKAHRVDRPVSGRAHPICGNARAPGRPPRGRVARSSHAEFRKSEGAFQKLVVTRIDWRVASVEIARASRESRSDRLLP